MTLKFADLRRGAANRHSWCPPFDDEVVYENERWWGRPSSYGDPWYVQVLQDGAEVARVKLDDPGGINPEYVGVRELGPERLEIQFIEVAAAARGRDVGTAVVRALARRHEDRRLFAYSEKADGFWASLGWDQSDHPRYGQLARSLFIQPARGASAL